MRQRLDQISNDITKLVAEVEPKYVAMEDFVYYGNRGQTTSSMPVLIENIRMLGKGMGYDVAIYTNAYWKSILLKNHTADKHQVEHRVHMLLNLDAAIWNKSDPKTHMRDAMAIALTFWQLHTHKAAPPKRKGVPMKELKMKWSS
jgi:Holliday junction resolvasome RuvABC endonuclease subunit